MWITEPSSLGRIVVPPDVPAGFAVFSTTRDFHGRIDAALLSQAVRERVGIDTTLTSCRQVHGANVVRARREDAWRECDDCDGLWSSEKGTSLVIKVADCLPVTLIDDVHGLIANVHSGWRGAVQQVTAAALDAAPLDPASTHAFLGPSIRVCCFEVGEEVASQFEERFVDRTRPKPHVDLVAFTSAILRSRGIERISDSGLCTRCEGSMFHSYRRDGGGGGRNLVLVAQ